MSFADKDLKTKKQLFRLFFRSLEHYRWCWWWKKEKDEPLSESRTKPNVKLIRVKRLNCQSFHRSSCPHHVCHGLNIFWFLSCFTKLVLCFHIYERVYWYVCMSNCIYVYLSLCQSLSLLTGLSIASLLFSILMNSHIKQKS